MDKRSEALLANVDSVLADKVRAAANQLATLGTYLLVVSGLRTAPEQNALYAQGRNGAPGHIVTNAKAGYSTHNYGLAVDVVPYLSGKSGQLNWDSNTPNLGPWSPPLKPRGSSGAANGRLSRS